MQRKPLRPAATVSSFAVPARSASLRGALLVADDVGNVVWHVSASGDAAGARTAGSGW
ncbi:Uncharacterized protein pbN1_13190 [Aromatoleum bremense]|nr:Uncharacterized protein pbN1_13190 [Aromatoleum bremense]